MGNIETCPNCDCVNIRRATEKETTEFKRTLAESNSKNKE
jgi:hypothetical protein